MSQRHSGPAERHGCGAAGVLFLLQMKAKQLRSFVIVAGVMSALATACSKTDDEHNSEAERTSRVRQTTNGETIVTLDAEARQRIGLKVETPAPAQWQAEITGQGRILDPGPLAALMTELVAAHLAATASQQELERLQVLARQTNASVRALQTAEATANHDQVMVDSLRTRVMLGWGRTVLERGDPPQFVRSLASGETALARIDLPPGESPKSTPLSARLVSLNDAGPGLTGEFFDLAPTVDPQTQGRGYLFLIKGRPPPPGTAVTGYLRVAGEARSGLNVPREAVLRHEGRAWVYVQSGDDSFTRREITLDRPTDNGWFIAEGLSAGDRVVVRGAQSILSEELSGGDFQGGARD